jgi:hypothetical protein
MDNQFFPAILASVAMSAIQLLMRAKRALSQPDLACAINDPALTTPGETETLRLSRSLNEGTANVG